MLSFGVIFEPKNAYAGFEEPEPEVDHGQVLEVHCDVFYEWILEFFGAGERFGEGECTYIFEDEFELEVEVEISGEFEIDFFGIELPIAGTFHIEDFEGNAIWIEEEGIVELFCNGFNGRNGFNGEGLPYCLETEGTVTEGDGIFTGLTGTSERTASGFIIFFEDIVGAAEGTVWVFFDLEEEEEESTATGSGKSYKNNNQPSVGVTETGKRVVDGGITVNGHTVDANFYFTPFPLIQSPIGQPIDFVFKIWDDRLDNIKHLQLQLGKGKIGESFTKVASATYDRNKMTGLVTVTHDSMFTNVVMEQLADQPCRTGSGGCTVIHVRLTPTQPIIGNVVWGLYIWDEAGNAVTIFFNEGIQIGTETDVIKVDNTVPKVIKKQLRTDDGWGNIDKRYSEAFAMKLAWHNEQVQKKVIELGYVF